MATVKIVFDPRKVAKPQVEASANVCAVFDTEASYVDSQDYEGTRYDSNVPGMGIMDAVEPYASTSVPMSTPLAQFKMTTLAPANELTGVRELSFEVSDYKEVFYYKQLGEDMKDQGFEVTVTDSEEAAASQIAGA